MRGVISCGNIFVAVFFLSGIFNSEVQAQTLPELSKIEGATLFCSDKGGMYAINFKDKRVWQGDVGETDGLELTHVSIKIYRCPNCYDIQGTLADSVSVDLKVRSPGSIADITMVGWLRDKSSAPPAKPLKIGPLVCSDRNDLW